MKKTWFAIKKGRRIGVFNGKWSKIRCWVDGYAGARFKGFYTKEAATAWYHDKFSTFTPKGTPRSSKPVNTNPLHKTSFYNGEALPWSFPFFIDCIED